MTEIEGGGFYVDLEGLDAELAELREELETYPYDGQLGVQGRGGRATLQRRDLPDGVLGQMIQLMHEALPEGSWDVEWWLSSTPETAAISEHDHGGAIWAAGVYVGLPDDPSPLVLADQGAGELSIEAKVGRLIIWPGNRPHHVAPRASGDGLRLAIVINAHRP